MGGSLVLHFGLTHPQMCRSLIVAAAGSGSVGAERWKAEAEENAKRFDTEAWAWWPTITPLASPHPVQAQDPRGWQEFRDLLAEHSSIGAAHTFRGVQIKRPSLFDLKDRMNNLTVPTLIMIGDEDEPLC